MPLSWNEIKTRAAAFSLEWKDSQSVREKAEAQTFEAEFLKIFGVDRKKVALFEQEVRFGDGQDDLFDNGGGGKRGYIDLFWKGKIIIEMKTPGKDLDKAYEQAKSYALALPQKDIPRGILTCDFLHFQYYDLEDNAKQYSFRLDELPAYIELFGYLAGYKEADPYKHWDPVNISAAEKMGQLHDRLKEIGYTGHRLELYLVRLLFCLFADDTGIFEPPNLFNRYIIERTGEDGGDLALHLQKIFETLNTPQEGRLKTIDIELNRFPYINGHLFAEPLGTADFDGAMRDTLIQCCTLEWSKISPAIFGSMFQSVMNDAERHDLGAHYTSEQNILKLIHPLFLDNLWDEFNKIKKQSQGTKKHNLILFHDKLCRLTFLDPACGCGNFLVISYRELRLLEIELIKEILQDDKILDIELMVRVNVDQFYGIEIEEFPARIAQTALWLMDHLMNNQASAAFGKYIVRIPLTASATIVNANSLTIDWETIVPKNELSYILGNPPFLGSKVMTDIQRNEVAMIFDNLKNCGILDYVTCWYGKAAQYIQNTQIEAAFVSTNSICQGEQVPVLWPELMNRYGIKINFAHQTFKWSNEARGKAAVYCVIIGFSVFDRNTKQLFYYSTVTSNPTSNTVSQINAYLVDSNTVFITSRSNPLCKVPPMCFGNMPLDGGNLLLSDDEKNALLQIEPETAKYIKPFISAREFLNNMNRWCLWFADAEPHELRKLPEVKKRIEAVKAFRLASRAPSTREHAVTPALFRDRNQPDSFIVVPRVSSETRKYIPMGFFDGNSIAGDTCMIISNGSLYHFGIITSSMHMAWMRSVCGRLELRYRYSKDIVYNNFPWPIPTQKQIETIEKETQEILDIRTKYPNSSLADLYDPLSMPADLVKAHRKLDKAVESAYGRVFDDDSQRVAYLFELYQKLCGEMFAETRKRGKGRKV